MLQRKMESFLSIIQENTRQTTGVGTYNVIKSKIINAITWVYLSLINIVRVYITVYLQC